MKTIDETNLRVRMSEEALLEGLSKTSSYNYFLSCRKVWREIGLPPEEISNEDLRQYFISFLQKNPAKNTLSMRRASLRFLYEKVLHLERPILANIHGGKERKLPPYMSMEEVQLLISAINLYHYQTMSKLAFSCGLRISEVLRIRTCDIDKYKMTLFIPNSKGRKDRYVPLPLRAYLLLRDYWRIKRPSSLYIFVNAKTSQPYCRESLEKSFSVARDKCALNKCYTFHTLRHSYATCLMEAGIDIRMLQVYLGHSSLKTTMMYIHMSNRATTEAQKTVERLFSEFNY